MVVLLGGRRPQCFAHLCVARRQRLAFVQRLCADFARMVHAHQARRMLALRFRQRSLLRVRRRALGNVPTGQRPQSTVEYADQVIHSAHGCPRLAS